jgi:predicted polyphosphate/ATP-dependent NAD kinase
VKYKIGLIINPIAGIGGAVGLKGSDTEEIQKLAFERGAQKKAAQKAKLALEELSPPGVDVAVYAAPGEMGAELAASMGFDVTVTGHIGEKTTPADTVRIAREMSDIPVDILMFAGGDGTARNIYTGIDVAVPCLGVPAGVKIHSAVYATTPSAAGKALAACLENRASFREAEVMDIDEDQYRKGRVQARLFGYLSVPAIKNMMQNPKAASHNDDNDVAGICQEIKDQIAAESGRNRRYLFGAGSTVYRIMDFLGAKGTLLGIDVWENGHFLAKDAAEAELLELTRGKLCTLIITVIGGQGHIFGRGNQQLSPVVIRQIGLENIHVVAAAGKIYSLPGQTLFVDTGDEELNNRLRGYRKVIVGWQETLVCRVM